MKLVWMSQLVFVPVRCEVCQKVIQAWRLYFRACHNPDSADDFGYNCCIECRKKMPNTPPPKDIANL